VPGKEWDQHRDTLAQTDVIFTGSGAPVMNEAFLEAAPRLKAVFYAGESARHFATDELWERGIRVSSARSVNAIPVAEYTSSVILLGLKRFWHYARQARTQRNFLNNGTVVGAYRSTVGLISYGRIARLVRQRLLASDVRVLVYDPYLTEAEAFRDGVQLASIGEIFSSSDAVSLHTPHWDETEKFIDGRHFERMKSGAIFINTARGEIVDEPEMIEWLQRRPDLQAVLDVTSPEPPAFDSPLYSLPNVVLTPHIAESLGNECSRMGNAMVDEFEHYLRGDTLRWELTAERVAVVA
jgi:phosphoglycerate dehydrogenase-like enzyme